jgi:aspartate ammonia-lyase
VPYIGYANASRIASEALETHSTVRELVIRDGLLSAERLDALLSPQSMLAPQSAAA